MSRISVVDQFNNLHCQYLHVHRRPDKSRKGSLLDFGKQICGQLSRRRKNGLDVGVSGELGAQGSVVCGQGGFGGCVVGEVGGAEVAENGGDGDESAASWMIEEGREEEGVKVELGEDVGGKGLLRVFWREFDEAFAMDDGCAVDENCGKAKLWGISRCHDLYVHILNSSLYLFVDRFPSLLHSSFVGDVNLVIADTLDRIIVTRIFRVQDRDRGAPQSVDFGNASSQAAGSTRHDNDLLFEIYLSRCTVGYP